MRLLVILLAASLAGCASQSVRTDMSTVRVGHDTDQSLRRAERKAERRRMRPERIAAALVALEAVNASLSAAVAIKEAKDAPPQALTSPPQSEPIPLLLVADDHRETFLGCLSCDPYEISSIFNAEGDHGSRYSQVSIRNRFSRFGNSISDFSACNPHASRPPLIVDADGNTHGRFTVSRSAPDATVDRVTLRLAHMICARPVR